MPLECNRCRAEYAQTDAFCRKCGASLATSTTSLVEQAAPQVVEGEVVELGAEKTKLISNRGLQALAKVGAKAGEKLYQALQSETGKKLTQGATTIALTIGTELATRAVKNMVAPEKTKKPAPPAKSLTDQLLNAFQNTPTPSQTEVTSAPANEEEVVVIERFYRRRVYRRKQD